jgi:hypothetical protein
LNEYGAQKAQKVSLSSRIIPDMAKFEDSAGCELKGGKYIFRFFVQKQNYLVTIVKAYESKTLFFRVVCRK